MSAQSPARRLVLPVLFASAILMSAFAPASATVPAPNPESLAPADLELWLQGGPAGGRSVPAPLGPFNYLREFDQIVGFLAQWQVSDPDSSDYGGMIEAESGALGNVIQTDNTLEAIWCWSRYREFSGRTTYDANVAAAWVYSLNFPAWNEEGAANDNYYRVHNCAWGLTAVLKYKAATGDASHDGYAETCAQYIVSHPLVIDGNIWSQRLDAFCKGWAAGNLYLYGEAVGNAAYKTAAVTQGTDVRNWINNSPILNMAVEYWAMSSGTAVWGICNSVFRNDPIGGQTWLAANAGYMELWEDWYVVPGYVWDNAWNVAYGNAHFSIFDVTGNASYWNNGVFATDALLSYDTDDDGGITSESIDLPNEDMCWVTSYLCKFGVDRLMGTPLAHDTGVLRFAGIADGDSFDLGDTVPLRLVATNYGLSDESDVEVHLTGDAGTMMQVHDLPFAALNTLDFLPAWIPPDGGYYTLTAYTALAGDMDGSNDSVTVTIFVDEPTAAPGADASAIMASVTRNPFRGETGIRFALAEGAPVRLEFFDVRGRRVALVEESSLASGEHTLIWNGRDDAGRPVPAGLYLYRLSAGSRLESGKVLRLR